MRLKIKSTDKQGMPRCDIPTFLSTKHFPLSQNAKERKVYTTFLIFKRHNVTSLQKILTPHILNSLVP